MASEKDKTVTQPGEDEVSSWVVGSSSLYAVTQIFYLTVKEPAILLAVCTLRNAELATCSFSSCVYIIAHALVGRTGAIIRRSYVYTALKRGARARAHVYV